MPCTGSIVVSHRGGPEEEPKNEDGAAVTTRLGCPGIQASFSCGVTPPPRRWYSIGRPGGGAP